MERSTHGVTRALARSHMQPFPVRRPRGVVTVLVRRSGVAPTAGCAIAAPIWLVTRLKWQFSDRTWSVEVASAPKGRARLRPVEQSTYDTRAEADSAATDIIERAKAGEYDGCID